MATMRSTSSCTLRDWAIAITSLVVIFGLLIAEIATTLLRSLTSRPRASLFPNRASLIFWNTVIFWISA
jgi:hypothetical protein